MPSVNSTITSLLEVMVIGETALFAVIVTPLSISVTPVSTLTVFLPVPVTVMVDPSASAPIVYVLLAYVTPLGKAVGDELLTSIVVVTHGAIFIYL